MDVKQYSVLIAIRYVLLDFRQNGHEKWYVYLLHFVVNCIAWIKLYEYKIDIKIFKSFKSCQENRERDGLSP